ncbi:hypothetical protein BDD12DRAFT_400587 [Trichophaea hybrida]|nr:hypothetical protein BDD12DRAFT_400587 [Trichophaea hybrida]
MKVSVLLAPGPMRWRITFPKIPVGDIFAGGGNSGYGSRRDFGGASSGGGDRSSGGGDRYSGYSRADDSERFPARAQLPVPDKPPYTAHVGNLSFDVSEGEISDFFAKCDVSNVRLVRDREQDRPKGFGYVEFNTKEGLVAALDLNGTQLAGRSVRINVAEPPKERADDRTTGEWRRTGPLPSIEQPSRRGGYERHGDREEGGRRQSSFNEGDGKVRDFGNWERKGPLSPLVATSPTGDRPRGGDREFRRRSPAPSADGDRPERGGHGFRERPAVERQPSAAEKDNEWRRGARPDVPQRSAPASPVLPHTRPKLELKKRSEQPIEPETPTAGSDKPNPFGGARPIDTAHREKEVEERRIAVAASRKAAEEKAREERKVAREAEEKASEAGTPVTGKNFEMLRRGSGSTNDSAAPAGAEEKEKTVERKKPTPTKGGSDNWRSRGPKEHSKQQPKQEGETDGWSTVPSKRGGRGMGNKSVSAQ